MQKFCVSPSLCAASIRVTYSFRDKRPPLDDLAALSRLRGTLGASGISGGAPARGNLPIESLKLVEEVFGHMIRSRLCAATRCGVPHCQGGMDGLGAFSAFKHLVPATWHTQCCDGSWRRPRQSEAWQC